MTVQAKILVVAENATDASRVSTLLSDEFSSVCVCADSDRFVEEFDQRHPNILIFALNTLWKTKRCYLELYRRSSIVHALSYRTLVLCGEDDLQSTYELCSKKYFDDYILFWPMTRDTTRLPMAVHHALWAMSNVETGVPTASRIVTHARPLLELQSRLERYAATGLQRIEAALNRLRQTGEEHCSALQPVREWAENMQTEFASQTKAASVLKAIANDIRPLVLVVDGEAFQRRLLQRLLTDIGLESIFATSAMEALATVTKRRPDLIVTNVKLPDLDGIELTRRLKSAEPSSGVTVMMITDRSDNPAHVDGSETGAPDFVIGPLDRRVLLAKIRQALNIASVS